MKIKSILRATGSLVMILSLFVISSCTKSSDENAVKLQKGEYSEEASIDEKDFTESDEDLSTVDYKEFYDQLSPYGEWIEVSSADIGMNSNTAQMENKNKDGINFLLSDILGVKYAKATAEITENKVFVWKPSVDLGVSEKSGDVPVFTPYTNGQWVNTDAGWYFKAPTPAEETVSHYGRWVNTPAAGWLWVPGRVWAPAWVDWKQNENYVSWAPLPPSSYLISNVINEPVINVKDYVIVDRKYFLEPAVYKYNTLYYKDGSTILVKDMTGTKGIVVVNNTINNIGPDVNVIRNIYGKNIEFVKLHHVQKYKEVIYSNGDYYVYTPGFRKYKNKGNKRVKMNMPQSYIDYDSWNTKNSNGKGFNNDGNDAGNNNSNLNNGNNGNMNNDHMNNGNNGNMNNGNNGNMNNDHMNNGNNGKKNNGNSDHMNNGNNGTKNNGNNDHMNNGNNGNMNNDNNGNNGNNSNNKGNKNKGKNDGKGNK